ncbi:MAG: SIR2 family protein, partial [Magnetococcales bacterium]|nr:SIR2 family protein [Magnetococcales bacterium]
MQFIKNGPEIPEALLQAHEEGRVVFFCGAGISYPAGLPGFSGLVEKIYAGLGEERDEIEQAAFDSAQYDTVIGLLERRIVDGRRSVRSELAKALNPEEPLGKHALTTHRAILTLAQHAEKGCRLVTTNFDRLFEHVIETDKLKISRHKAPLLPIPKVRWNGLVYLHGLLATEPTADLDHLVVSSGDFGLAYLVEQWAARFVSELFRNFTVCFVGYSINDPILRYMVDALAADRLRGEAQNEIFAFGSYSKGQEETSADNWKAKNVTPILYQEYRKHHYLHNTLQKWAAIYQDGIQGKEDLVQKHAANSPAESTGQDNFVGRIHWALSDRSGLPAKCFADHDPVPPLEWLKTFSDNRYRFADLDHFGVPPRDKDDKNDWDNRLTFSLVRRPAPYEYAPFMALVGAGAAESQWDQVMFHLARWLTRHLNDPELVLWLAQSGGQLHDRFAALVEHRIGELDKLKQNGEDAEIQRILSHAPNAIPCALMRTLWRLFLTGRVRSLQHHWDLYPWRKYFKRDGLTPTLRLQLREMLTPRVVLSKPLSWGEAIPETAEAKRIQDLVRCEIKLTIDSPHAIMEDLSDNRQWTAELPNLLTDFSSLLRDTLDLMRELGESDDRTDSSYIYRSSISEHPQNNDFRDWTALISLARDAWLATAENTPDQARSVAENWWKVPYPLFKRLAFFAASQPNIIPHRLALDWLLADDHWWLWSVETKREAIRLLVSLAPNLSAAEIAQLEQAILLGPPRSMYNDNVESERWTQIVEH